MTARRPVLFFRGREKKNQPRRINGEQTMHNELITALEAVLNYLDNACTDHENQLPADAQKVYEQARLAIAHATEAPREQFIRDAHTAFVHVYHVQVNALIENYGIQPELAHELVYNGLFRLQGELETGEQQ